MIEQLATLLIPIDALLSHDDFNPHIKASDSVVSLFRNMWFLCALFHFTTEDDPEDSRMEWQRPALIRIAAKTPALIIEESHDIVASDVEYNSVIRQEYVATVSQIAPMNMRMLDIISHRLLVNIEQI
jgi:phosphatidylinositol 4-kinase A